MHTQNTSQTTQLYKTTFVAGLAMFAMFFGSGNLVFPLIIGRECGLSGFSAAYLGLVFTGVWVPFLGLLGVVLYAGDRKAYFAHLGKWPAGLLTFAMLALMGPFGVGARCVVVAHGAVAASLPAISLWAFGLVFMGLVAWLLWQRSKFVHRVGAWLTPALLIGLALFVGLGVWDWVSSGSSCPQSAQPMRNTFSYGLIQGYQTMDLLAAFFFSAAIVEHLRHRLPAHERAQGQLLRCALGACVLGGALLALVYLGLVFLGAHYSASLAEVPADQLLVTVAKLQFGSYAMPVVAVVFVLACLTTSVVLADLFGGFLCEEVFPQWLTRTQAMVLTVAITFAMSLLGFAGLTQWLGMLLEFVYPALIALAVANLLCKLPRWNLSSLAFWGTLAGAALWQLL
ncbi:MAG TPA: branched-chain amino acid transport system II carrier protein [Opitutales bacterium]|nr:branched-chain amino acid transport system II carrier protein [Opitutales bacterium]